MTCFTARIIREGRSKASACINKEIAGLIWAPIGAPHNQNPTKDSQGSFRTFCFRLLLRPMVPVGGCGAHEPL